MKKSNFLKAWGLWASVLGGFSGCSTVSLGSKRKVSDIPVYRIFVSTFDRVWDATAEVLDEYTIQDVKRDAAYIVTDFAEIPYNPNLYEIPIDVPGRDRELKYRLHIKLSKAIVAGTREPAVRVQITKEIYKYTNILTEWERIPSDLVEEKVLLYRIGRRLEIVEALRKKSVRSF